jgi:hypothetical protein
MLDLIFHDVMTIYDDIFLIPNPLHKKRREKGRGNRLKEITS